MFFTHLEACSMGRLLSQLWSPTWGKFSPLLTSSSSFLHPPWWLRRVSTDSPSFFIKGNGCKVSRLLLQILFVKLTYFNYVSSSNFYLRIFMLRKQKFYKPTQRPCTHIWKISTKLLRCCGAYFVWSTFWSLTRVGSNISKFVPFLR